MFLSNKSSLTLLLIRSGLTDGGQRGEPAALTGYSKNRAPT